MSSDWGEIRASLQSSRTVNPIRDLVDQLSIPRGTPDKPMIPLSIGDPTIFGNFPVAESVVAALHQVIDDAKHNGYPPSTGYQFARDAVALKLSEKGDLPAPLKAADIVLASGCSGALDLAICALCDPGTNILIPAPGFSLYRTLAESYGFECRPYNLDPDRSWEADLDHAASLVDENTRLIVVNNPSNPCGSVYSKSHLQDIVKFARVQKLPILADEIYGDIVFKGHEFVQVAAVSDDVPILSVGGIAKQYVAPGWRLGWVAIHDRGERFGAVRIALTKLSQLILGPNSLVQGVLPSILHETKKEYLEGMNRLLENQAEYIVSRLSKIPGLRVIPPQGAMYVMTKINVEEFNGIENDMQFAQKLLNEELVFVLPGRGFNAPNYFRIVYSATHDKLAEACDRITSFCAKHHK